MSDPLPHPGIVSNNTTAWTAIDHFSHIQDPEITLENLLQLSSGSPQTFSDRKLLPLAHIGIDVFCEWTTPQDPKP